MKLKEAISIPCGLRYMVDSLDIQSGVARRMLLEQDMAVLPQEVESGLEHLSRMSAVVLNENNALSVRTLQFRLQGLKDLRTTLDNLRSGRMLDDIELFEIKHLAMLTAEIAQLTEKMDMSAHLPDLSSVVSALDPEGLHIATFYIYDAYCPGLKQMRSELELHPTDEKLFIRIQDEENRIRVSLSAELIRYVEQLADALYQLAQMDILLAKALQMRALSLCIPTTGRTTSLVGMWNPEVEEAIRMKGGSYQRNSISFASHPTILTGSNMGGKTVVLRTVALCQLLTQFGFAVPAEQAEVAVKDAVYVSMADGQSVQEGLSSFAAEMRRIDSIIAAARANRNILALIDEPARTTNPIEGTALVSALIEVLKQTSISMLLVTHYTINAHACPCLRVRGMENGRMNYELVPALEGEVPHEALHIAEQLGVDTQWIALAHELTQR
ncbi:MAG: DNA mismatch repair protein MutS [Paludibacteraceae bacterium]|nr:DNA mismatch repair protein MutS [Paludibacteraceae bacterium]